MYTPTNRRYISMRISETRKTVISGLIAVVMAALVVVIIINGMELEAKAKLYMTQQALAEDVLRFHILANSDSEEDQALKMQVKEEVISYMEESLSDTDDLLTTQVWAENQIEVIEELCVQSIQDKGYDYSVSVTLEESYFPVKTYGDITFPEGEYQALRIEIGQAEGQNWWCCLYPELCFIDATYGIVTEDGKEVLREELTEAEYEMITQPENWKVSWFFF